MFKNLFQKLVPFMRQRGKNMEEPDRPTDDNIMWRMHFACWICL